MAAGCEMRDSTGNSMSDTDVDFEEDDYKKIVPLNNQLGFDLLSEVEEDGDGNTFISPISLYIALSMVYNGADGVTKGELAKVLHFEDMYINEFNKASASLMSMLHNDSEEIQLHIASSIWLNKNFHFQNDFSQHNSDYFHAEIQELDISDSTSPQKINDWVKKSTKGKIEEIVETPLNHDLVALLINAIYFKGGWKYEFDEDQTEKQPFCVEEGVTKDVPLMTLTEKVSYMENDYFQSVSLPYGDSEMSMNVFLPKPHSSTEEIKKMLANDNWKKWRSAYHEQEGTIILPKFQMEYEVLMNDTLEKLGMKTAFDKDANFTKMIKENEPVWISKVKQKTFIEVTEEGTEASASTSVEMVTESALVDESLSFHMEVNRPFFFAITDDETGTILFMGDITNPQAAK